MAYFKENIYKLAKYIEFQTKKSDQQNQENQWITSITVQEYILHELIDL